MKSNRLPPLRSLRVLESFIKTGSVTATARDLNVSHSAISHQLRQIEEWAGIRLMRREGRQTILTEAGESLAHVIQESFGAIRHEIDRLTMRESLPISIAALRVVIPDWLLPRLDTFMEVYTDISVHVQEQFSDHPPTPEPDISIGFALSGVLPEKARPIISGQAIAACSPAYLQRHPIHDEADIARGTLIHDEDTRMWDLWLKKAGLDARSKTIRRRHFYSGSALIGEAARRGTGIALCREVLNGPYLASGTLVKVSDIRIDEDAVYYIQLSKHGRNRASAVKLVNWLLEE